MRPPVVGAAKLLPGAATVNGAVGTPLSNGLRDWKTAGQPPGFVIGVQAKLPAPVPGFAVNGCAALMSVV